VRRTVHLAFTIRPPLLASDPPPLEAPRSGDVPPEVGPLATLVGGSAGISRIALILFVLLLSVISLAIGSSMALIGSGWSLTDFRTWGTPLGIRSPLPATTGPTHCQ
jgi:hypothetical protein